MARAQKSDSPIDRLYQLPLSEFVTARNALAKESGADAAEVRSLQKPSLPAWAVNQLYWQRRDVYDDLIARAQDLRATHDATLSGKRPDLRGASRAHEDAVDAALKATLGLLAGDGQPVTEATRQAVATTLRGLPADEPPGRLTRQLQPRGFEMLAGAPRGGTVRVAPPPAKIDPAAAAGPARASAAARTRDRAAAREALTVATRDARLSEQAARREEFEAARAARDADKAQQRVEIAKEALREAQAALDAATREAEAAAEARATAQERARRAVKDVKESREREKKARLRVANP
jgi:hypothetical protein